MSNFLRLYKGQTLLRIMMNDALTNVSIYGRVVDIGGARNPDYFEYFQKRDVANIEAIDGKISGIDFEKDKLPFDDASIDTVLLFNVLEHIYNYSFLLGEINRIIAPRGQLVGFVPFWVGYHPDPHDYFRYTDEALKRIFEDTGFSVEIRPIGAGPLMANFNTTVLSLPRILRPLVYVWYAVWDKMFVSLRPQSVARNPLGFIFIAKK